MNLVLDASAMIAFLRAEEGSEVVLNELSNPQRTASAHALNLCEVFYDFARASNEGVANDAVNDLLSLGIEERNDMQADFWLAMGRLKSEYRRISLADCAAVALALKLDAILLTADRHELGPLQKLGICRLAFIR